MPLGRYFLYVGGALLALLFFLNAYLPSPVAASATASTTREVSRPFLRIHSAQKLPERIVIDTSIPTIVPPPTMFADATVKAPVKAPVLDALAQISPSDLKGVDLKKPAPKAPPKRRVAKRTVRQPMVALAQVPPRFDFDLFAHN
jgi:hypothetical protein